MLQRIRNAPARWFDVDVGQMIRQTATLVTVTTLVFLGSARSVAAASGGSDRVIALTTNQMEIVSGGQSNPLWDVLCSSAPFVDAALVSVGFYPFASLYCGAYSDPSMDVLDTWTDYIEASTEYALGSLMPDWVSPLHYYEFVQVTAYLNSDTDETDWSNPDVDQSGYTDADFCGDAGCDCASNGDCLGGYCDLSGGGDIGTCSETPPE